MVQLDDIIADILAVYPNLTEADIAALVRHTDIGGVSFVRLTGYNSEEAGFTEMADHTINVGAAYGNMLAKDVDILANFDVNTIDIERWKWSQHLLDGILMPNPAFNPESTAHRKTIPNPAFNPDSTAHKKTIPNPAYDAAVKGSTKTIPNPAFNPDSTAHKMTIPNPLYDETSTAHLLKMRVDFTLPEFKAAVKAALPIALVEMLTKERKESHNVWLNRVLAFNTNTQNILLRGQSVVKVITQEGEYAPERNSPKAVAKMMIKKVAMPRSSTLRYFAIQRMESIRVNGDTLIIG